MLVEQNRFHSEPMQVLDSTLGKSSRAATGVYNPQRPLVPNRGVGLETSTRKSGARVALVPVAELVLVSVFLLSLFLTGCSPSMHQANLGPPEVPPLVVISGTATISGDLVVEAEGSAVMPAESSNSDAASGGAAVNPIVNSASYQEQLVSFSQEPAVQERIRRVTGWLEFGRSRVALPRLNSGAARVAATRVAHSDSALGELFSKNRELALWRELLVNPDFDSKLSAEELVLVKQRLDQAAVLLAAAEKPEDVQELDRVLTITD
jgi:hypothetical protein